MGCSPWGREESDTIEQLHFSDLKIYMYIKVFTHRSLVLMVGFQTMYVILCRWKTIADF